ncbi:MAG: AEC family transporter [Burkholderiales bacterium]
MVLAAVETVIAIFLMIGAGVFVAAKKWVDSETMNIFPKIIVNIAIPCMIVYFFSDPEYITRQKLIDAWLPIALVFIVTPLTFILGKLVAAAFRIPATRRGVFAALFPFSNSIFIGVPVATALFGSAGLPFVMYYYLANTTYFWTLGFYSIRRDADLIKGENSRVGLGEVMRKLVSPPMITLVVMFIVVFSGVKLPPFLVTAAKDMNGLVTPLSLVYMGCMIYGFRKECFGFERDVVPVMLGRFLIAPGLMFAACTLAAGLFGGQMGSIDPVLLRNVVTVQAGLPAMTNISIVAAYCGADSGFATKSFFWTTLFALLTIPAYMLLFYSIG